MNNKYNLNYFLSFVLTSFIALLVITFSKDSINQFYTYFLLIFLSVFLIDHKDKKLFYIFFFISFFITRLIAYELVNKNGIFYTDGLDDQYFNYAAFKLYSSNFYLLESYFLAAPYKLFILFLGLWIKIIDILSFGTAISDSFHYSFLLINNFCGAISVVYLRKIITKLNIQNHIKGFKLYFLLFNPIVIYYSAILLREIWVIMFFTIGIYILIDKKKLTKVLGLIIILICLFFIRPFHSFIFLLGILFWNFLSINKYSIKLILSFFILILTYIFFIEGYFINLTDLNERINNLQAFIIQDSISNNSIGIYLFSSNNVFITYLIRPIYVLLSPFPPPIISQINIISFLISYNILVWIAFTPFYILYVVKILKNSNIYKESNLVLYKYIMTISFIVIISTLMINFLTGNPRHNSYIYTLSYPFLLASLSTEKVMFKKNNIYFILVIILFIVLILNYVNFKVFSEIF